MIDKNDFINKYFSSANDIKKSGLAKFIDNLEELANGEELAVVLKNKQLLCNAFYLQQNGGNISRAHYLKIKSFLSKLQEYLNISEPCIPSRDEVIEAKPTSPYFKGIDELLDFIDTVGKTVLDDYNPTQDLIRVKSLCIFGWLGFSLDEISKLKISDLTMVGANTYIISNKYGKYEITGKPFAAIYYLTTLEKYRGFPTGKIVTLKNCNDSLFKIKQADGNNKQVAITTLVHMIRSFNKYIPKYMEKTIIFRVLHQNALFIEVYNDKTSDPLELKIKRIMNCDYRLAKHYKYQYFKFIELPGNNEIIKRNT